jgi:sugar phosphate isomerase/epimerase
MIEGRLDEALERAQEAVSLAQRHQERSHAAWSLRLLGEIASHRDPPDVERAEGYYRESLALAGDLGMRPLVVHCHVDLGQLFRKSDQQGQAREQLTTATTMCREMDMRAWLGRLEAELRELA